MITKTSDRAADTLTTKDTHADDDLPAFRSPVSTANPAVPQEQTAPARPIHVVRWLVFLALVAAGWYYRGRWPPSLPLGKSNGVAPAGKSSQRVIPVRTATVEKRDLPLFINGLGTVTAFKTVTLKSRVDGELIKVAFTEGQMV